TLRLRRRAWPLLLNFRSLTDTDDKQNAHPDEGQVDLDLRRTSLPESSELRRDPKTTKRRQHQLGTVVRNVLRSYPWLSYYQGYHELALTYLLVFGSEQAAAEAAKMTALFFVRDAMGSNLDHVLQQLQLLYVLLQQTCPKVHRVLTELDVPPFFAISWVLTWFAHDVASFDDICRIFDFLIVSPTMQVVYMAAAVIACRQDDILACERDFAILHTMLTKLPAEITKWDDVIADSYNLELNYPPLKLQHLGNCHLPKLSDVNTYEATWKRLDPVRPVMFTSLVPITNAHPLAPKAKAEGKENRMAQVIELTNTAHKARELAMQHKWPLLVATVASTTLLMYMWVTMQHLNIGGT
ncbi:GTPase-activating protein gyp8, partial [Linderina pennispora]